MIAGAAGGVAAVLVAAGSGERLGAGPKALVEVGGVPLVLHAARALAASGAVGAIVAVAGAADVVRVEGVLAGAGLGVPVRVVAGGATRAASVRAGLDALGDDVVVVAVHDAARALVSPGLVARTVAALEDPWDAVAPAVPVVDTLKEVAGKRVVRTVDRSTLAAVQTPQVFPRMVLARAHAGGDRDATDDLVLVEAAGGRVRLVEGERRNLKITHPEDLVLAEVLLGTVVG